MKIHNALAFNWDELGVVMSFFTGNHCADFLFLQYALGKEIKQMKVIFHL